MLKNYSFQIEEEGIKWKVEYQSKKNCSRIKSKLIKALWEEDGLTVDGIKSKIAQTSSHIPSSQQMGNILKKYDLFKNVGRTTVDYLGSKCDRVMVWKLNMSCLDFKQVA